MSSEYLFSCLLHLTNFHIFSITIVTLSCLVILFIKLGSLFPSWKLEKFSEKKNRVPVWQPPTRQPKSSSFQKPFLTLETPLKRNREIKINVYFLSNFIVSWNNVNLFSHRVQPTQTDWWDIVDDMRAAPCLGGW